MDSYEQAIGGQLFTSTDRELVREMILATQVTGFHHGRIEQNPAIDSMAGTVMKDADLSALGRPGIRRPLLLYVENEGRAGRLAVPYLCDGRNIDPDRASTVAFLHNQAEFSRNQHYILPVSEQLWPHRHDNAQLATKLAHEYTAGSLSWAQLYDRSGPPAPDAGRPVTTCCTWTPFAISPDSRHREPHRTSRPTSPPVHRCRAYRRASTELRNADSRPAGAWRKSSCGSACHVLTARRVLTTLIFVAVTPSDWGGRARRGGEGHLIAALEENIVTATFTADVFPPLTARRPEAQRLGRLLGRGRPRAARPPPRVVPRGAADGVGANAYRLFERFVRCWARTLRPTRQVTPRSPGCRVCRQPWCRPHSEDP